MSSFFDELMESVQQMDEIHRGERQPSREFTVDPLRLTM
jgi:putative transcriptional regulator